MILEILLGATAASLLVSYGVSTYRLYHAHRLIAEMTLERMVLVEMVESFQTHPNLEMEDEIIHKENFIKFLSDSREDAFAYIETSMANIQDVLKLIQEQPQNDILDTIHSKLSVLIDTKGNKDER